MEIDGALVKMYVWGSADTRPVGAQGFQSFEHGAWGLRVAVRERLAALQSWSRTLRLASPR